MHQPDIDGERLSPQKQTQNSLFSSTLALLYRQMTALSRMNL